MGVTTIEGTILKRNRVNFSIRIDGCGPDPCNLRITEETEHLQAGDRFNLLVETVYKHGRFQYFKVATPELIDQWERWTRNAANRGDYYGRGMEVLKAAGRWSTILELDNLRRKRQAESTARAYCDIIDREGRSREDVLETLRCNGYAELTELLERYRDADKAKREIKKNIEAWGGI